MENPFAKRKHDSRDLGVAFCNRHAGTPTVSKNKILGRLLWDSGYGTSKIKFGIEWSGQQVHPSQQVLEASKG